MLRHRFGCQWVGCDLDYGHNGIADDVSLPGWEQVDCRTSRRHECNELGGCRGGVHKVEALPNRCDCWLEGIDNRHSSRLGNIAQGLLLNRAQAAPDIALCWLRSKQVSSTGLDLVNVGVIHGLEAIPNLLVGAARCNQVFPSGQLRGLAKNNCSSRDDMAINGLRNGWAGTKPGGGIRLTALNADDQFLAMNRPPL